MTRAIFLDRDDTLMINVPYLGEPSKVLAFPEASEALNRLAEAGFLLFIITNQSGVGRGMITVEQVDAVNQELLRQLHPVPIRQIYQSLAAPNDPDPEAAFERKPSPGLLLRAAREHGLDLTVCVFIGDRISDMECARNAGSIPILLRHRLASAEPDPQAEKVAATVVTDLHRAADWILSKALLKE
jgi:D-glycero-D-manno-heptose 1,7-bisphosphate phosphatase